ncbi:hypothetical protein [Geodermatophilus sp. URMC 63]
MVDPLSATAIGAVVLAEGIKFLYNQAGELLKRYRERKDSAGKEAPDGPEPLLQVPSDIVAGTTQAVPPDYAVVEKLAPSLLDMRRPLADYAQGLATPRPEDPLLMEQVNALRELLEMVYGQRITFKGEAREPSGPLVRARGDVDRVQGYAAVVHAKSMTGGQVDATGTAKTVERGGTFAVVDIDRIG